MTDTTVVAEIASRYVNARDTFTTRYRNRGTGAFGQSTSPGGPIAFSTLMNEHAKLFAEALPPMNLAQWEGLSELASTRLAWLRMSVAKR